MKKVALIGVGQSKFGNFPEKSIKDLFRDAYAEAVDGVEKGIELRDIKETFIGSLGSGGGQLGLVAASLISDVGLAGIPTVRIEGACASSGFALRCAVQAVTSGTCDIALAGGIEKMNETSREQGRYWLGISGETEWERLAGTTFPGVYALMANRHMHEYGTTEEQLALVAVKNHRNGSKNPKAHLQFETTLEKVLKSPVIAAPLKLFDCCPTTDGASVAIVCDADKAKKYTDTPVYVIGFGAGSDHLALFERDSYTTVRAAVIAATQAYKMAHLDPKDIDFAEVHDCFTIAELMAYEDLGFCKKGEAGKVMEEGITEKDGEKPVNVSGGLKSKGHPIGATGVAQIYDIFKQLRGEAEKPSRQLHHVEIGLAHNVGGSGGVATVHILSI